MRFCNNFFSWALLKDWAFIYLLFHWKMFIFHEVIKFFPHHFFSTKIVCFFVFFAWSRDHFAFPSCNTRGPEKRFVYNHSSLSNLFSFNDDCFYKFIWERAGLKAVVRKYSLSVLSGVVLWALHRAFCFAVKNPE